MTRLLSIEILAAVLTAQGGLARDADPVTIIVNHKPIAKGEVVMVEGNYGVRILEVESKAERIRSLG